MTLSKSCRQLPSVHPIQTLFKSRMKSENMIFYACNALMTWDGILAKLIEHQSFLDVCRHIG